MLANPKKKEKLQNQNLHSTHTQNHDYGHFRPRTHLQLPHQKDGQYGQGQVADDCKTAIHVDDHGQFVQRHACSRLGGIRRVPEVGDGSTIEQERDPEHQADGDCHTHDKEDDCTVDSVYRQAEEGNGDGQFGECGRPCVEDFAQPPVLD